MIDVGIWEVEDVYVRFLENGVFVSKFVGFKECYNVKVIGIIL